ncbi:hypothetical protein ACHHRT_01605 [Desulfurivibrio sp. D14AmB]|uniref:hypothetical protein n=1 Tax=Desulfurivibrio sp. D14AmB TaxID=3374370 RepID=UPI00376EA0FE
MTKQSGKWCAAIALLSCLTGRVEQAQAENDPYARGVQAGQMVLDYLDYGAGINERFSLPLTGGGEMQTVDGESTFSVPTINPSSTSFVTVLVQPEATGDLNVQLFQDLDFSGTTDYSFSVTAPVSGVCANGVISCDPGTWNNCSHHQWTADEFGRVTIAETSLNSLGGCYCINQSCGSNLVWSNLGMVLKHLGGGIVSAIQQRKDSYIVTQASIDGPSIAYYGQDTSSPAGGTGTSPQAEFYQNPEQLTVAAEMEAATQASDPDSLYSAILTSYESRGGGHETVSCSITRLISAEGPFCERGTYNSVRSICEDYLANWPLGTDSYVSGFTHLSGDNFMRSMPWMGEPVAVPPRFSTTFTLHEGDEVLLLLIKNSSPGTSQLTNAGIGLRVNSIYAGHWRVSEAHYPWGYGEDNARTLSFTAPSAGDYFFEIWAWAGDPGSWWLNSSLIVKIENESENPCLTTESINDSCLSLANDSGCNLRHENVDGVTTYTSFNPTFLNPLPSSRDFGSGICSQTITRNWWKKDRQYLCQGDSAFDFTDIMKAANTVVRSTLANEPGNTIHYETWQGESGTIVMPELPATDSCLHVCKTRAPEEDTQVSPSGTRATYQISIQSWSFFYRTCVDQVTCPVEPGEEIVTPCGCLNEFAEAASIMSALDSAGKDMICSDGVKK